MEKNYTAPEFEVVRFKIKDVICTSQTVPTEGAGGGGNLDNDDDWDNIDG